MDAENGTVIGAQGEYDDRAENGAAAVEREYQKLTDDFESFAEALTEELLMDYWTARAMKHVFETHDMTERQLRKHRRMTAFLGAIYEATRIRRKLPDSQIVATIAILLTAAFSELARENASE